MHLLTIIGSIRKNRHTHTLVARVLDEMRTLAPDLESDLIYIADQDIHPCRVVCSTYCSTHPYQCAALDDANAILARMSQADALIIGAPLYFRAPPAQFQAWAERLVSLFFFHESQGQSAVPSPLKGKLCGLVGVAEYSNPHQILEYLHDFCTVLKMRPVLLDTFPYLGVAGQGDVENDAIFHPFERTKDLAARLVEELTTNDRR
ncbi:MAG TPA: NAD(P)H-dependent oxidoreductase [Anaerolineae bacterium]|nr:NAD(P)H-dependent oxidoreductase [Anaerolineae bacterium]